MVPRARLELAQYHYYQILSLARLPISPPRLKNAAIITRVFSVSTQTKTKKSPLKSFSNTFIFISNSSYTKFGIFEQASP